VCLGREEARVAALGARLEQLGEDPAAVLRAADLAEEG
jgi:hypothetical protein